MKVIFKTASFLIILIFFLILILSYGISTSKFNDKIISQIKKKVPNSEVNFKNASISLDILTFSLKLKINNPVVKIDSQKINLISFMIYTDLKSSLQEKYLLKKIEINFGDNQISSLKKISFVENIKALKGVNFIKGTGSGKLIIDEFQNNKTNTIFDGELNEVTIGVNEDLPYIKKINGKINYSKKKILLSNLSGNFGEFDLVSQELVYFFDQKYLLGAVNLQGRLNPSINLEKILPKKILFNFNNFDNVSGQFAIDANLKVYFNDDYSIKKDETTFNLSTKNLKFNYNKSNRYIFENINSSINFNNYGKIFSKGEFEINKKKNKFEIYRLNSKKPLLIKISGKINLQETFFAKTNFPIKDDVSYSSETSLIDLKRYKTKFIFNLNDSKIDIPLFNYIKEKGEVSKLEFYFLKNNNLNKFNNINYVSQNKKIYIQYLVFNNNNILKDLGNTKIDLGERNKLKIVKKNDIYNITGTTLDLSKYLSERNKKQSLNFKSQIDGKINIVLKKIYLPVNFLIDYKNFVKLEKGEIRKLNSNANFDDATYFSHKIFRNEKGNKSMVIKSDKAKPLLSNYKFLKGLKGGTLKVQKEYLSKNKSITEVKIENFYLREMPLLTKILSVASLTGALDILDGKGIFFKEALIKYELIDNELKILECYGTGPSLGFVIEGKVGKDDFKSLNGSLAPANTINNIVREIPLVGKILTGSKGDGIFGASFKIKGKDKLQTEVNPIKTITPRFIQRFLKVLRK